ncbi:MAG: SpaH/EbpB family LPXTG-anchored major pilin [Pseudobutyrivibrio sp.]|nr:SpaH/EbpB family LPXTG-anchored major pilin [Pseudobutyrivibrio sp.]
MRNVKKIITLVIVLAMMLSMTVIASAAEPTSAQIKVTGAEGATLAYAQVIKADPTTETGWEIVDGYTDLFAAYGDGENTQSMIKGWMDAEEDENTRIGKLGTVGTTEAFTSPLTDVKPGLYVIKGEGEGYTYSTMLAYVSYEDYTKGNIVTVVAKKTPTTTDKELVDSADTYVEIGDEVSYKVKATVPYLPKGGTASLVIKDEITGGKFKLNGDKVDVSIKLGEEGTETIKQYSATDNNTKIEIDLSYLISEANTNANVDAYVTYTAIVDGSQKTINNKATINNNDTTASEVKSYTAKLKITKKNQDGTKTLEGAVFAVVKAGKYAVIGENNKLNGWSETITEANYITTGPDGTATVDGFDADETYAFHEVVAPEGYKLNPADATAEWQDIDEPDAQIAEAIMNDTTLSSLPYTGGKGTAAFTGCGVLLMSIAAGLYYSNKKHKSSK